MPAASQLVLPEGNDVGAPSKPRGVANVFVRPPESNACARAVRHILPPQVPVAAELASLPACLPPKPTRQSFGACCHRQSVLPALAGSWIKGASKAAGIPVYSIKTASISNLVR